MNINRLTIVLVLLSTQCVLFGQQPIKAPASFDKYRLSNIRIEDNRFGQTSVMCDYKRTKKGEESHLVRFAVKTETGIVNVMGSNHINDRDSGVISLSKGAFGGRKYNYEIYLIADSKWAGESFDPCIISNTVSIGNTGKATVGRLMNAAEKKAYQRHVAGRKPPTAAPPSGYEMANLSTELLPGMYVMAGRWGDWEKAEFLGLDKERRAKLRFEGENKVVVKPIEKWIAANYSEMAKAKKSPDAFKPSGVTLEEGKLLLPVDAVPLDYSITIVPGTPLIHEMGSTWRNVIFTKKKGSKLSYRLADFGAFSRSEPMNKFAIKKSVLQQLKQPDAEKKFAENLYSEEEKNLGDDDFDDDFDLDSDMEDIVDDIADKHRKAMKSAQDRIRRHQSRIRDRVRDYPVDSAIPKNCQLVPEDLEIPKGTKVAACFHFDWSAATVISDPGDGTLEIDWDEHAAAWNGRVKKDQLIIQKKSLTKIKKKALLDKEMTASELAKITRTWTDSSGQHKVKANFVKKTDKEVVLKLEDGFEKTIPLAKLSKEDRELLSKLKEDADNPFAR